MSILLSTMNLCSAEVLWLNVADIVIALIKSRLHFMFEHRTERMTIRWFVIAYFRALLEATSAPGAPAMQENMAAYPQKPWKLRALYLLHIYHFCSQAYICLCAGRSRKAQNASLDTLDDYSAKMAWTTDYYDNCQQSSIVMWFVVVVHVSRQERLLVVVVVHDFHRATTI